MSRIMPAAIAALMLAGCAKQPLPEYVTSRDTLTYLHRSQYGSVAIEPFKTRRVDSYWFSNCDVVEGARKARTKANPETYGRYIRGALARELAIAGKYSEENPATTITGTVEHLSVSRLPPYRGFWNIQLALHAPNKATVRKRVKFEFDADGLIGPSACRSAIAAFAPAVQKLVSDIVTSPEFAAMARAPREPGAIG